MGLLRVHHILSHARLALFSHVKQVVRGVKCMRMCWVTQEDVCLLESGWQQAVACPVTHCCLYNLYTHKTCFVQYQAT